jgi:hemolysin III
MSATYTDREELAHSITHGFGVVCSVVGLVLMVIFSARYGTIWHVVSTTIFGATLVLLYTSSTLYHSYKDLRAKQILRKFDHAAIFLLIAGSYTPFLLVTLRGAWGMLSVVWGLAAIGVALKFWFAGRFRVVSTLIYIGMGWLVLVFFKPLAMSLPHDGLVWLFAGGLCYTGGTLFYLWKRLPYHHAIWHLFVLGGSACHWVAIFFYVVPRAA